MTRHGFDFRLKAEATVALALLVGLALGTALAQQPPAPPAGPVPYFVGNPLGMPINPDPKVKFEGMSSNVKVYGSVYSAESCSYDPVRKVIVVPNRGVGQNVRTNDAWITFLNEGGRVEFAELSPELLTSILNRGHPIVCGLSATWLYRTPRERPDDNDWDDIAGDPCGHFVVICGYSGGGRRFMVRDPSMHVPFSPDGRYVVPFQRLINAILLGDVTQDAVLLELWPKNTSRKRKK